MQSMIQQYQQKSAIKRQLVQFVVNYNLAADLLWVCLPFCSNIPLKPL